MKKVVKKAATKMKDGGDTAKFYKTNRRGNSKEISREKYFNKVMNMSKPGRSTTTVTNNPETTNYVYDEKDSYPITSPANTTVRTTKTKGFGKGKSVSRVDPLEKQKKGGAIKATAKKPLRKAQNGTSVGSDSLQIYNTNPNFSYDTSSPQVFKKPIAPKKPQTGRGSGMGRMYMDDMSNSLSEQKKGGSIKKPKLGSGERFKALSSKIQKAGKSEDAAKAIAAAIGRKKYGNSKFQKMAAAGRKKG